MLYIYNTDIRSRENTRRFPTPPWPHVNYYCRCKIRRTLQTIGMEQGHTSSAATIIILLYACVCVIIVYRRTSRASLKETFKSILYMYTKYIMYQLAGPYTTPVVGATEYWGGRPYLYIHAMRWCEGRM
jgi:hypothetical protein